VRFGLHTRTLDSFNGNHTIDGGRFKDMGADSDNPVFVAVTLIGVSEGEGEGDGGGL
jgi:hypothetical protein